MFVLALPRMQSGEFGAAGLAAMAALHRLGMRIVHASAHAYAALALRYDASAVAARTNHCTFLVTASRARFAQGHHACFRRHADGAAHAAATQVRIEATRGVPAFDA